jgi:hypothetical protein
MVLEYLVLASTRTRVRAPLHSALWQRQVVGGVFPVAFTKKVSFASEYARLVIRQARMGIQDRRRRRALEAAKYGGDMEAVPTENTLTLEQTLNPLRDNEGAVALKGEQLLVLLTVCCQPCSSSSRSLSAR